MYHRQAGDALFKTKLQLAVNKKIAGCAEEKAFQKHLKVCKPGMKLFENVKSEKNIWSQFITNVTIVSSLK